MLIASAAENGVRGVEGHLQRLVSSITSGEMDGKLKSFFIFLIVLTVLLTLVDIFISFARVKTKKTRPEPERKPEDSGKRKIEEWFTRLIGVEFVDEDEEERPPVHSSALPTIDDPDEQEEAAAVQALRDDYDTVPLWEDMSSSVGDQAEPRRPQDDAQEEE